MSTNDVSDAIILHVEYKPSVFWASKLLAAMNSKDSLRPRNLLWPCDLAFSIETRLGALGEIIREVDRNLHILDEDLKKTDDIANYLERNAVYRFKNEAAVRRVLIGANAFITESRSCFENLASFYRTYLDRFLSEIVSKSDSYAKVASMTKDTAWADHLRNIRHNIAHEIAPWLAFLVHSSDPKYEPILVFNLTAETLAQEDYVAFETLRQISNGLAEAAPTLIDQLTLLVEQKAMAQDRSK